MKCRSENWFGFLRPGLKTGVENGIFWSEIGSGFGDAGSTPPPKIPRSIPPGYIYFKDVLCLYQAKERSIYGDKAS